MSRCPKKGNRQLSPSSPWHPHRIVFVWLLVVAEGTFEGEVVVHPIKQVCRLSVLTNIIMFKGNWRKKLVPLFWRWHSYWFSVDVDVLRFIELYFFGEVLMTKFSCLLLYGDHLVDIVVVEGRWENVLMTFRNEGPLDQAPNVNTTTLWVSDWR